MFVYSVNQPLNFSVFSVSWTPLQTVGPSPSPRGAHTLTAATPVRIVLYGGWDPTYLSDMHLLECLDEVRGQLAISCTNLAVFISVLVC